MNTQNTTALARIIRSCITLIATLALGAPIASAQVLVGDVFTDEFDHWEDTFSGTPGAGDPASWGALLTTSHTGGRDLIEDSDGRGADGTANDGDFTPFPLINTEDVSPATYNLSANVQIYDNDGFGLVFGYQDNNNYFRASFREQAGGGLGFPDGTSVQKVVGGVVTQLGVDSFSIPITGGVPSSVSVAVDGANWEVSLDDFPVLSGSDADLAPGNYGVHSWGMGSGGMTVQEVSIASALLNKTHTFAGAVAAPWRALLMQNSEGASHTNAPAGGNFHQSWTNGTIEDGSNGFLNAVIPNTDFVGPAVVVDSPGNETWTDYRMRVKLNTLDNDGIGVLFRVADDDSFYRINFEEEANTTTRPALGMSVQKNNNGTWTQLFADDSFVYTQGTPFDVTVQAVGDTFFIQVDDPVAGVISYPLITDASDPILAGSVGFTQWGNDSAFFGPAGGDSEALVEVISAISNFVFEVERGTGNISLSNGVPAAADIREITIQSDGGALDPNQWTPIAGNYDEPPPGDGSVDSDDKWTVTTSTDNELTEAENSGGDGGTIGVGDVIDLGNAWRKSTVEDLTAIVTLADGTEVPAAFNFVGTPFSRSDLNTDGFVNDQDWPLFYPNTLADLSGLSDVKAALAGDLNGDGKNNGVDFGIFKFDFDAENGVGAFEQLLASVPEPSGLMLLMIGALGLYGSGRKRFGRSGRAAATVASLVIALVLIPSVASAVDFTTYTTENYPETTFGLATWEVTPTTATIDDVINANPGPSVLYGTEDILNKRIVGTVVAGTDDDIVGLMLGFNPGDTFNFSANYLMLDWKGATQSVHIGDAAGGDFFHDQTIGPFDMPAGLALSRINGIPNADEMWAHMNSVDQPNGGVTELARGATLGATGYPGNTPVLFDIRYTADNVTVLVDGVEQFNIDDPGAFGSGRLGLYQAYQDPKSTFSDFSIFGLDQVLTALVHQDTGEIELKNNSSDPVEFDYYQIDSAGGNSLDENNWLSLDEQDHDMTGGGEGESWNEAVGSDPSAIGELYLQGSTTLLGSELVSIGNAYKTSGAADLSLKFRLKPDGLLLDGIVEYVGEPPTGFTADFDGDGDVDGDDFLIWQRNIGLTGQTDNMNGDANGDGTVDGADLGEWKSQFGSVLSVVDASSAVPEPMTGSLLSLALAAVMLACRRRAG